MLYNRDSSHSDKTVEISGFIAMSLNLDAAAKDLNELFPLQLFREATKTLPSSCQGLFAVNILSPLDLSCLVVSITLSEGQWEYQRK